MDQVDKDFIEDLQQYLIEWDLNEEDLPGKKVYFTEDKDILSSKAQTLLYLILKLLL